MLPSAICSINIQGGGERLSHCCRPSLEDTGSSFIVKHVLEIFCFRWTGIPLSGYLFIVRKGNRCRLTAASYGLILDSRPRYKRDVMVRCTTQKHLRCFGAADTQWSCRPGSVPNSTHPLFLTWRRETALQKLFSFIAEWFRKLA